METDKLPGIIHDKQSDRTRKRSRSNSANATRLQIKRLLIGETPEIFRVKLPAAKTDDRAIVVLQLLIRNPNSESRGW